MYLFRDGKSLFLIDLEESESHQILEDVIAGHGLSQLAVVVVPESPQKAKEYLFFTTTWFQQYDNYYYRGRDLTRQLITFKFTLP
jgi:hypothetical protein